LADYTEKRDYLCDGLRHLGFQVFVPEGTYYALVDIRSLGFEDDVAFCRMLPEKAGVAPFRAQRFISATLLPDIWSGCLLQERRNAPGSHTPAQEMENPFDRKTGWRGFTMKIAAVQMDITWHDREANHAKARQFAEQAKAAGADLLVLPEMFLHSFSMDVSVTAETLDGPTPSLFRSIARAMNMAVVEGLCSKAEAPDPRTCRWLSA